MADVISDSALLNSSEHFNYTEEKKQYLDQVKMYYANRKLPVSSPFTREVVDRIKNLIKEKQFLMEAGHPSQHAKYTVVNRYEIIEQNGEEILTWKRILPDYPIIQVIPAEDCFDILMDAHLKTNHGSKDKMLNIIKRSRYVVPKTSFDFLLGVCKICTRDGRTKGRADQKVPRIFHSRGQVSLVDMTEVPDGQFKHILCYVDRFTTFTLLRPLMTDSVQETAIELMKIFFDFGPPQKLETYNRPFFAQVMSLINTAHSEFNISLVLPVKMPILTALDVQDLLKKWQNDSGSSNWAMGCYMVQWNNNSKKHCNNQTPYCGVFKHSLFGKSRSKDLKKKSRPGEHGLINGTASSSTAPSISKSANSVSNTSILIESDCEEQSSVHHKKDLNGDDYLITITDVPNEQPPPVTTVPVSNKQPKSKPSILKRILLDVSNNAAEKNEPLLVLSPFKNIEVKNNNNTLSLKQVEDDSPKPNNKRCHVCKTEIKKAYICLKCDRNVHLFCSDRLLQPNISPNVLSVTCTSCTLTKKETEIRKRKRDDGDIPT